MPAADWTVLDFAPEPGADPAGPPPAPPASPFGGYFNRDYFYPRYWPGSYFPGSLGEALDLAEAFRVTVASDPWVLSIVGTFAPTGKPQVFEAQAPDRATPPYVVFWVGEAEAGESLDTAYVAITAYAVGNDARTATKLKRALDALVVPAPNSGRNRPHIAWADGVEYGVDEQVGGSGSVEKYKDVKDNDVWAWRREFRLSYRPTGT